MMHGLYHRAKHVLCLYPEAGGIYPVCLWYLLVFHSVIAFVPPEINYRSCVQHRNRCYYSLLIAIAIDYTPLLCILTSPGIH